MTHAESRIGFRISGFFALWLVAGAALAQEPGTKPDAAAAEEPTLLSPPRLKKLEPAVLPDNTPFPGPEVAVQLSLEVSEEGKVIQVTVQGPAGEPFDSAAVAAARRFEFAPALLSNGRRAAVTVDFRMRIQRPASAEPRAKPEAAPPPVRFRGRLLERGSRKPLPGVEVSAQLDKQTLAQAVSDGRGEFALEVPAERFALRALPVGHQRLDLPVQAVAGEEREEVFYLESEPSEFETVVRAAAVRREVTKQVLPKKIVESVAGTQGDTLKVVQNLPGVGRPAFGGGALILRGASPEDSRVFLEGHEIPALYHFGGLRSSINSAFLEAVEFVPGNFGADYGRATGGVIEVRLRDPARDLFRGNVDLNFFDAGFALEGPLGRDWSMGGAFHRSYIDAILPAVLPKDASLSFNAAPRYYDYQWLSVWKPDSRRKLRVMVYGSMDKAILLFARPQSDPTLRGTVSARVLFHNLAVDYQQAFSPRLRQETSLQLGWQQIRTAIGPDLYFNLDVVGLSVRSSWAAELGRFGSARAGLDLRLDGTDLRLDSPLRPLEGESRGPISSEQRFGLEQQSTFYQPAIFFEYRLPLSSRWLVLPSLRLDWYREIERLTADPRLVVRYEPRAGTALKGGVGLYQQPPTPDQSSGKLGNPALLALRSLHASLGLEQRLADGIELEVTGFYKKLDRLVTRNPAFFSLPSAVPYLSEGTGRILGAEVLVRARYRDRLSGWLAYTFQRSFRTDGPGTKERRFEFDQPHILTLVGTFAFSHGWSLGARFRWVSGSPLTPVLGSVYDTTQGTFVPLYGEKLSDRLGAFHQLDVRVDKTWTYRTWRLSVYLDVQNAYNHGNPEGRTYNFDYSENQDQTGLPVLPILGVKGEW